MTLHPITVVDQVLDEYRDHLLTEFRARDERLRKALQEALEKPEFLAREPFFQAHRPFKSGARWRDLGLDPALAKVMEGRSQADEAYLHQSEAIRHLLGADAGPLVITTGTGSGKTECFLLPVIQNAIEESVRSKRAGITAILVYPMNALANDQTERIERYLEATGHTHVKVARYDRSTKEEDRQRLRKNPPHILLTNYMMLEYLLVRPADRGPLFANHRCRFVVLDEVHTYRGSLGANIALLFRRLLAHLRGAVQDGAAEGQVPTVVPVATSATIKSLEEAGRAPEEVKRLRDEAVQGFLERLTGLGGFRVISEELRELEVPAEARWSRVPVDVSVRPDEPESVRRALARLGGQGDVGLEQAARGAAILWKLNALLARRPLSVSGIVERILAEVPERKGATAEAVRKEVEAALVAGSALPDDVPGAVRLRTHRFIRGGWRFFRCVDPECGKLYPMGQDECVCGAKTAPLYLCRNCGAHTLRFRAKDGDPEAEPLVPNDLRSNDDEVVLYEAGSCACAEEEEGLVGADKKMKGREVNQGSFDPATLEFSCNPGAYSVKATLAPARTRCLVCGGTAGSRSVITPVELGTSAAVRVLCEGLVQGLATQNKGRAGHDGKDRLLVFSDSRQDAAHQARFITYAGRYDRMRRRLMGVLKTAGGAVPLERVVEALAAKGIEKKDNRPALTYSRPDYVPQAVLEKARAWEEAPLLDDLAVTAGYRATVLALGLVGVRYEKLDRWVAEAGGPLAAKLGLGIEQLAHLCRCLLDEMRERSALSRPLLCCNPSNPSWPEAFRDADWDRRYKFPIGWACNQDGQPIGRLDAEELPSGMALQNSWRASKGRQPALGRVFCHLLGRMKGTAPTEELMLEVLRLLCDGPCLIKRAKLYGHKDTAELLMVNDQAVALEAPKASERFRCQICNVRMPWVRAGFPCPSCHGTLVAWPEGDVMASRYAQRVLREEAPALVAGEHTAQVTGDERIALEDDFKGPPSKSPINVLACSPTLEMGIDVGGLDAIVLRNVPPRPDNYAQRGGRAGRRSRVGIVVSYARNTPHDGYFFDRPGEMIAGEVPAPPVGLGNRDVLGRHMNAILLGMVEPGLAGKLCTYVDHHGKIETDAVDELVHGIEARIDDGATAAVAAIGWDILRAARFDDQAAVRAELAKMPARLRNLFDRVALQVQQQRQTIETWNAMAKGDRPAMHAMDLIRKLLGMRGEGDSASGEADDRTAGHPMRRMAEFGLLPGYEFPSEPCSLRLLGDKAEEETLSVERRFGLGQYQPEAPVHARGHRWKVWGLDTSSPWNPKSHQPGFAYVQCACCDLRYEEQGQKGCCPRCGCEDTKGRKVLPGHEFGGFVATRDDAPVLEEEDRFGMAQLVQCHPQWDGEVMGRWTLPTGWRAELRRGEEVRWLNEGRKPTQAAAQAEQCLHPEARGFPLCPECGRLLEWPALKGKGHAKGRAKPKRAGEDPFKHAAGCPKAGTPPKALALSCVGKATTLRFLVDLPPDMEKEDADYQRWGESLGAALRRGIRQLFMLDGPEVEFVLEPAWEVTDDFGHRWIGALTFIDPTLGGSGFLEETIQRLDHVARQTIEHLKHEGCDTACYRCLKNYQNQRVHTKLSWPTILPDLDQLASAPPDRLPAQKGDKHDPRPWLAAYAAGCGSPLELAFAKLFEKHGLSFERQVPVAPEPGGPAISVADFADRAARVAVYVDGAAFHRGSNLRRDRLIRGRLEQSSRPWKVFSLGAKDLGSFDAVAVRLKQALQVSSGLAS